MAKKFTQKEIDEIREYYQGYAFGKCTSHATDDEIQAIVNLKDERAKLHNEALPIENRIKSITKAVEKRCRRR
jgi:hypothetical protein